MFPEGDTFSEMCSMVTAVGMIDLRQRPGEHQHFRGEQKDKKKPAKENKYELRDQAGEGTS